MKKIDNPELSQNKKLGIDIQKNASKITCGTKYGANEWCRPRGRNE